MFVYNASFDDWTLPLMITSKIKVIQISTVNGIIQSKFWWMVMAFIDHSNSQSHKN